MRHRNWAWVTRALGILSALTWLAAAHAQQFGFNIDLDEPFAPPEGGGGAPSSAFAAMGSAGYWNALPVSGFPATQLRDLSGQLTGVACTGSSGGTGGGYNFPGNTGDFALLLNDCWDVGGPGFNILTFSGVPTGRYRVFSYVAFPSSTMDEPASILVSDSVGQNPQTVTGHMPGNQFTLGANYCIHDISVSSGTFTVEIDPLNGSQPCMNGLQIVPVPEPTSVFAIALAVFVFRRRRTDAF